VGMLLGACATTRIVPVPAAGVALDAAQRSASREGDGVQVVVRPSAWQGSPSYLADYVTPFHFLVVDGSALPLRYDYADLKLFDEARFQYTALPPADVARILGAVYGVGSGPAVVVAAAGAVPASLHSRRAPLFWDPWWTFPAYPYPPPPRYDDVFARALPVGTLEPGARVEGFVYFPRLRREAQRLTLEFHHRLGDAPRVLTLPFAVERAAGAPDQRPAAG
jgi:hypothetical protein